MLLTRKWAISLFTPNSPIKRMFIPLNSCYIQSVSGLQKAKFITFVIIIYDMKKSLQRIEDFYVKQGYKGDELRKILSKDKEYQKILQERKQKLTQKISMTKTEKK